MKNLVRKLTKLIVRPLQFILYWVSGFFPKDPQLWLFGSLQGKVFANNSRPLYLAALKKHKDKKIFWITRNKQVLQKLKNHQLPCAYLYSLKGLSLCLKAKFYIFDFYSNDICFWTSRNSIKINLWHGVGLKKVERSIKEMSQSIAKGFYGSWTQKLFFWFRSPWQTTKPSYVVCTSKNNQSYYAEAFGLPLNKALVTGYPRNDSLTSSYTELGLFHSETEKNLKQNQNKSIKNIFFFPTFRDKNHKLFNAWDFNKLDDLLKKNQAKLWIKLHPNATMNTKTHFPQSIEFLPHDIDCNLTLPYCDLLITDYSSIYVDFLLLDRPMIFYCDDFENYLKNERNFYWDYFKVTPGVKTKNFNELYNALCIQLPSSTVLNQYQDQHQKVKLLFHDYFDSNSSNRVLTAIEEMSHL